MGYRVGDSMSDDRVSSTDNIRIRSSSVIGDGGNISSDVVSFVGDVLDSAVGEVDRVGARVVVSHGVLVVVGGRLGQITRIITSDSVSYGVGNHRVGHNWMSHSVSHRVSYHRVSHSVSHRMSHDSVADELGTGGGHHQKGGEADKGLHDVV